MQITDIRIRKIEKEGKMKAVVSITIDGEFVVHDIKVIEGEKGMFIAMPSRKTAEGEYKDIAHPIKSETRESLQNMILDAYEKLAPTAQDRNALIQSVSEIAANYRFATPVRMKALNLIKKLNTQKK